MSALATPDDIAARVKRTLLPEETAAASAYLADVESRIVARAERLGRPDPRARAASDPSYLARLLAVECAAAIRAGRFAESIEDQQVETTPQATPGNIIIRADEWRSLGLNVGGFLRSVA